MIKKLEVEDIAKLLKIDDDVTDYFPCDRGEWVQFLISQSRNPDMFIIGAIEKDSPVGYMVAVNNVKPPLSDCVSVLFSKTAGTEENNKALGMLIEWAKEKGAKSIQFVTDDVVGHSVYGFKKRATLMSMEI